jgi:transposase
MRLARRAWLVLEEANGRLERELAAASGLRSRTVQSVIRDYRRHGLIGLVDAPRAGRPCKTDPSRAVAQAEEADALAAAAEHGVSIDSIWRYARLQVSSIKRKTEPDMLVSSARGFGAVAGIFADDCAALMLLFGSQQGAGDNTKSFGFMRRTERGRTPDALQTISRDWMTELNIIRTRSGACAPRAQSEAAAWFAGRASELPEFFAPYTALLAGDPCSPQFSRWLTAVRMWREASPSKWSSPVVHAATSKSAWIDLLKANGLEAQRLGQLTWPTANALPFVWCF